MTTASSTGVLVGVAIGPVGIVSGLIGGGVIAKGHKYIDRVSVTDLLKHSLYCVIEPLLAELHG